MKSLSKKDKQFLYDSYLKDTPILMGDITDTQWENMANTSLFASYKLSEAFNALGKTILLSFKQLRKIIRGTKSGNSKPKGSKR